MSVSFQKFSWIYTQHPLRVLDKSRVGSKNRRESSWSTYQVILFDVRMRHGINLSRGKDEKQEKTCPSSRLIY